MNSILKRNIYIYAILGIGILFTVLILLNDYFQGKITHYGYSELFGVIFGGVYFISGLFLLLFNKYEFFSKIKYLHAKIDLAEIVLILVLISSLLGMCYYLYDVSHYETAQEWSIGIYSSDSNEPFSFSSAKVNNPVLTYNDVDDISASFVADPFLFHTNDSYFLFFEVLNKDNGQGDIGLATSTDGYDWSYEQIVLDERFHLSYPCVFEWDDEYYMVPESHQAKSVRLYQASDFPYKWSFVKTLIEGEYLVDSTPFFYNNTWWMFTQTSAHTLQLYYSENLLGTWTQHPQSPIISGDANISRPGGNVVYFDGRLVRYTQDCDPYYGNQVWAFEITELSKESYEEIKIGSKPVLKGFDNWNTRGMHQVSTYRVNNTNWIAAVDGY